MVTPEKGCRRRKPEGEERVLGSPNIKAAGQENGKGREETQRETGGWSKKRTVTGNSTLRSEDTQVASGTAVKPSETGNQSFDWRFRKHWQACDW